MTKKYKLGPQHHYYNLYSIIALRDFGDVKKGDVGGLVSSEDNLSHDGNCWIADNAKVVGNARVHGNAIVSGNAWIYEKASIGDTARVFDDAEVFGDAMISNNAKIYHTAKVHGDARVYGNAHVSRNAEVFQDACVYGNARVFENARVFGKAKVFGNVNILGNAKVSGNIEVCGNNTETAHIKDINLFKEETITKVPTHITGLPNHAITVTDKYVYIGCEAHTLEYWLENYKEIGKNHFYTKEEIELYGKTLKYIKTVEAA